MTTSHLELRTERQWEVATAAGLFLSVAVVIGMVMHHPAAKPGDAPELISSIAQLAAAARWVHGILAVAITATTCAVLSFAARLGLWRPHVLLAATASALGLVLICLAVMLDGFVAPAIGELCVKTGGECAAQAESLLRFGGLQIEFLTRFGLLAIAAATFLWAADLVLRRERALFAGLLGLISAAAQFWVLFGVEGKLNPHSLALVCGAQAIGYHTAAAVILLRQGPYASSSLASSLNSSCPP